MSKMKVVVFERDATVRVWLESRVRARGHAVIALSGADAVWEVYAADHPALVILDWTSADGATLSRRIRASWPWERCVILATGLSDRPADLEAALDAGADDSLSKPLDGGSFEARLAVAERRVLQIEERMRAEARLRMLQKAVDTMRLGVSVTDLQGKVVYLNPAEAAMHGYAVEELIGQDARILSPREQWKRMSEDELRQAHKWSRERSRLRKDGSTLPVQLLSDVVADEAGEPVGLVTVCEDVTEREAAAHSLRESEERYALAARGANDGLWDWDLRDGRVHYSPRWKEMLGLAEQEVGDRPSDWQERIHPEDRERVVAKLKAHLDGRSERFDDEHRMLLKDGSYRWMLCRGLALRDAAGRPYRMAGAQTDVSDRRSHDPLEDPPLRNLEPPPGFALPQPPALEEIS